MRRVLKSALGIYVSTDSIPLTAACAGGVSVSNIKIGDKVSLKLRDQHHTRVTGTVSDVYANGEKLSVSLPHGFKCWSLAKDVRKV